MITRELLTSANIPGTKDKLRLFRHNDDFMIMLGGNELMNSRVNGSEKALAALSCEHITNHKRAHILIGGYGMGFTLRSALSILSNDAKITIAELIPEILDWAHGPMRKLTDKCLDDKRVNVKITDVANMIDGVSSRYDAILLDVDNGPDGLTKISNDNLYNNHGLIAAKSALKNNGILAIWSAHPNPKFTKEMIKSGFNVSEHMVRARSNGKGARHMIWLGKKT